MTHEQDRVSRVLVAFGRELEARGDAQVGAGFSGRPEADALLASSPNAFLLGVLFTQGIPAERAWAGPYLLQQRLGTLDLGFLASEEEAVRSAVQQPPMLHRFKETLPRWITSAARKLIAEYRGDAVNVWSPGSTVTQVTARLSAFQGIGRKKAVMATEILMRHFDVPLGGREDGQVAYDVHVRRVFLRSGLIDSDTPAAVEEAARRACPEAPGTLDLAAWLIGRDSCRPRAPRCDECVLGAVCPRFVARSVQGVG